jgi:hypothetical protein
MCFGLVVFPDKPAETSAAGDQPLCGLKRIAQQDAGESWCWMKSDEYEHHKHCVRNRNGCLSKGC